MPGFLSDTIFDKFIGTLSKAIWNRPELHALREPIETTLQSYEFKQLTRHTLFTFYERYRGRIPDFLDDGFIQQGPVQDELAKFIIDGREANLDELFRHYRDYVKGGEAEARAAMEGYLWSVREEFAKHPQYGPILQARDTRTVLDAINVFRQETHDKLDHISTDTKAILNKLSTIFQQPDIKAVVEQLQGSHVFLSYSRRNSERVEQIREALERAGHTVWQDTTAIKGGREWVRSIQDGIKRAYAVVTVVSHEANESEWVEIEFLEAKRRDKHIVPVKIDACEIPMMMLNLNVIHANPDLSDGINPMLDALTNPAAMQARHEVEAQQAAPPDRRQLEEDYLNELYLEYQVWQRLYTPMGGVATFRVESHEDDDIEMETGSAEIEAIFSVLDEYTGDGEESRHVKTEQKPYTDILEAVEDMRQLIILGDPGSGKTTTLWRIAADLASKALADASQPLPVFVRFGEMNPGDSLQRHIADQFGHDLSQHYETLLDEQRLIFLLDGLNELPTSDETWHDNIVKGIRGLIATCQQQDQPVAVTCRELDYTDKVDLNIEERVQIEPLNPLQIKAFVNNYITKPPGKGDELFWALAGDTALDYWNRIKSRFPDETEAEKVFWLFPDEMRSYRLQGNFDEDWQWKNWLRERRHPRSMLLLARNPYMLFMITRVFTRQKRLPDNRGRLFAGFIDYLLLEREGLDKDSADKLKNGLTELGYAMHAKGVGTSFYMRTVMDFLDEQSIYHARSANLLTSGDQVRFTHQLLQEYFAARKLDEMMKAGKPATDLWPSENWWEPTGWEETAILLAGLYSDDPTPVVDWLKDAQPELTARCVLESGARQVPLETLNDLQERWLPRLTDLKGDPRPHARAAVGRAIGKLTRDIRPGIGLDENDIPQFDWVKVPAGPFQMGGDPDAANSWEGMTIDLNYDYWIATYPVTYDQFEVFVDSDGYTNNSYWTEAGLAWRGDQRHPERYWQNEQWHISNHPVVGVTWYEAYAFTCWLTARLQEHGCAITELRDQAWEIRLPTESEWEKVARYPDGRLYPWGNIFDANKTNVIETDIRRTSAVGLFPDGANWIETKSIYDLSGNVWEWCLSKWSEDFQFPEDNDLDFTNNRVIRGGSWSRLSDLARSASRFGASPLSGDLNLGFRVVCAPANSLSRR